MEKQDTKPEAVKKPIVLITADIGWGSMRQAAEAAPEALLRAGLSEMLDAEVIRVPASPTMNEVELDYLEKERVIASHARQVSNVVAGVVSNGQFPVVIGGDHTSGIGFHTGLAKAYGNVGIIYMDTHPDLNTLDTSPSGNIHGMVMAILLGKGSDVMVDAIKPCVINETQVAMVGIRDIDPAELEWLNRGKINCMTMDYINRNGLNASLLQAIETASDGTAGFGLTIDLDVFDPAHAPFVATPVDGGINPEELFEELVKLPHRDRMLGLEVTEYTPRGPEDDAIACKLVSKLVAGATSSLV